MSSATPITHHTHYTFLVFGFGRIPIISWLREQASQPVTCYFMHNRSVALDEFARQMIQTEESHAAELAVYGSKPAKQ